MGRAKSGRPNVGRSNVGRMDARVSGGGGVGKRLPCSDEMLVPVHGKMYRVAVVPGPLIVRGKTTASRVMHRARVIEVDEIIPSCDRWRVAALAVAYACRPKFQPVRVIGTVE